MLPSYDDIDHAIPLGARCKRGHLRGNATNCRACQRDDPPGHSYTHHLCSAGHVSPIAHTTGKRYCRRCHYARLKADPVRWQRVLDTANQPRSRRRAEARATA